MFRSFSLRLLFAVGSVTAALLLSPAASAQPGGGRGIGRGNLSANRISPAEVQAMNEAFKLDEVQAEILDGLYEGYRDAYDVAVESYEDQGRDLREEARETRDWQTLGPKIRDLLRVATTESKAYEAQLFTDFKAILSDNQKARWEPYQRDRRRRSSLGRGARVGGEGVDLVRIIETLSLNDQQAGAIQSTLNSYKEELDAALIERDRAVERSTGSFVNFFSGDGAESAQRDIEYAQQKRLALRDVNERYAQAIGAQLDGEQGRDFTQAYQRGSYPRIYGETPVDRYLKEVLKIESISDNQRSTLKSIQADFQVRVDGINRRTVALQKERDAESFVDRMARRRQGRGGDRRGMGRFGGEGRQQTRPDDNDPRSQLQQEKRTIISQSLDSIEAVLSADQQGRVRKPSARDTSQRDNRRRGNFDRGRGSGRSDRDRG